MANFSRCCYPAPCKLNPQYLDHSPLPEMILITRNHETIYHCHHPTKHRRPSESAILGYTADWGANQGPESNTKRAHPNVSPNIAGLNVFHYRAATHYRAAISKTHSKCDRLQLYCSTTLV